MGLGEVFGVCKSKSCNAKHDSHRDQHQAPGWATVSFKVLELVPNSPAQWSTPAKASTGAESFSSWSFDRLSISQTFQPQFHKTPGTDTGNAVLFGLIISMCSVAA